MSTSLATKACQNLVCHRGGKNWHGALRDRNRHAAFILDPNLDRRRLDLDSPIAEANLEGRSGPNPSSFADGLGDDEATGSVDGCAHGIPLAPK
jgi:hypothetical protein